MSHTLSVFKIVAFRGPLLVIASCTLCTASGVSILDRLFGHIAAATTRMRRVAAPQLLCLHVLAVLLCAPRPAQARRAGGKAAAAAAELTKAIDRAARGSADETPGGLQAAIEAAGCRQGRLDRALRKPCGRALTALGSALPASSQAAEAAFEAARRADPTSPLPLDKLAEAADRRGDLAAAEQLWRAAVAAAPSLPAPRYTLALWLTRQIREYDALEVCSKPPDDQVIERGLRTGDWNTIAWG